MHLSEYISPTCNLLLLSSFPNDTVEEDESPATIKFPEERGTPVGHIIEDWRGQSLGRQHPSRLPPVGTMEGEVRSGGPAPGLSRSESPSSLISAAVQGWMGSNPCIQI